MSSRQPHVASRVNRDGPRLPASGSLKAASHAFVALSARWSAAFNSVCLFTTCPLPSWVNDIFLSRLAGRRRGFRPRPRDETFPADTPDAKGRADVRQILVITDAEGFEWIVDNTVFEAGSVLAGGIDEGNVKRRA